MRVNLKYILLVSIFLTLQISKILCDSKNQPAENHTLEANVLGMQPITTTAASLPLKAPITCQDGEKWIASRRKCMKRAS